MSWGERTCVHYGECTLEADMFSCNTFCWAYEEDKGQAYFNLETKSKMFGKPKEGEDERS